MLHICLPNSGKLKLAGDRAGRWQKKKEEMPFKHAVLVNLRRGAGGSDTFQQYVLAQRCSYMSP